MHRYCHPLVSILSRRRNFVLVVFVCCLSFFLFGWYTRREDFRKFIRSDILVEIYPDTDNEYSDTVKIISESTTYNTKRVAPSVHNLQKLDFDVHKLFHSKNVDLNKALDMELEPSGPTEFPKMKVTSPISEETNENIQDIEKSENDYQLNSTATSQINYELENSGPTEISQSSTAKPIQEEIENPETELTESSNTIQLTQINSQDQILSTDELKFTTTNSPVIMKHSKTPGLLLDTIGCKIPKLDPWDPTLLNIVATQAPYNCPGPPLFMEARPDGSIDLNETVLEKFYNLTQDSILCNYQGIQRKHEEPGNVRENNYVMSDPVALQFGVPLNEDYVAVFCDIKNETFEQYFPLVRLRKEIEEERSAYAPPEPRLNIILAGIDSTSKLNFLRQFKRTRAFLKEKMTPFDMKGYTKVGDNTFPNLVPLLTGHFVEHYWNESVHDTMYFDGIDLIWKDYAKKGFRTFYAEDSPYTGTFNYIKRGFYDPPTDYYFRPLAMAIEDSELRKRSEWRCLNSQVETEILYKYLKDFILAMDTRPFIAFAMASVITHDYLNSAAYADDPTVHMLEDLWNHGALNSSALFLFSDHGLRFGEIRETYIGKFEERMPFMYVHFPQWFLNQHPQLAENLHDNQERLITLFDVHATMIHLLDLKKTLDPNKKASITLGSSLLNEISSTRTCEEANILPHWCPCQTFQEVPLESPMAQNASQALVDDINSKLTQYNGLCAVLDIEKIMDVRLALANDLVLKFVRHDNVVENRTVIYGDKLEDVIGDYLITLTTKPGMAVFEGTVRYDPENQSYSVLGISRINKYGDQSVCIDSQKMKIFCYCVS